MKIFVLGGYGKIGLPAIKLFNQSDLVTEIVVAGRNLERAEKAAKGIGEKAIAVQADGTDEKELISLSAGYDFIVNAATNDAVVPSIRAAINNQIHYCDMAWAGILEKAMQLRPEAKAAGITAIIATGISPCISNLMGVHAAGQLDDVQQLQIGRADIHNIQTGRELTPRQWHKDPKESLTELYEFKSFIEMGMKILQKYGLRSVRNYHDMQWIELDPIRNGLDVPLARGGKIRSWPYFSCDDFWTNLPTDLSKVKPVLMGFSPFPMQLDAVLRDKALGVLNGEIDADAAIDTFYDTIEDDPHHWLTLPEDFSQIAKVWVRAVGHKDKRAARFDCWFTTPMWDVGGYFLTSVALVVAVNMVLRGEIQEHGVMTAEKAFEPLTFLNEVTALMPDLLPEGEIIDESFEWLD